MVYIPFDASLLSQYICYISTDYVHMFLYIYVCIFSHQVNPLLARRILIFPKGNNVDHLSMYLDVADSASLPYGWSRYAQFSLGVINQIHNKYSVRKGTFSVLNYFGLIFWLS